MGNERRKLQALEREVDRLGEVNDSLRSEKRILDEILDSLPGTFYIWDQRPRLIRWNRRHEEITEYSADDYATMKPTDFFDPAEHAAVQAAVEKVFTEGQVTVEATLVTKSGKKIPHVYTAVRTMMGSTPVLMGYGIDIRDRIRVEERLKRALLEMERLKRMVEADRNYLGEEIKEIHDYEHLVGESEVFKYVLYNVEQIASTNTTVIIFGESGTGKELIARSIHHGSMRKDRPLVKLDCAAVSDKLIESEFFGHEKGAFTGAVDRRIGRFELANGATIFLDEIGELPLDLQKKLLRLLQDGEFERLGSSRVRRTDARIIAATNRNLENDVRRGRFRKDLWYRLNVFPLSIPPLRERDGDIPLLVEWMVQRFQRRHGKRIRSVPEPVMSALEAYSWPGNVRELRNVIERAVIVTTGDDLMLAAPLDAHNQDTGTSAGAIEAPIKTLSQVEKAHILRALEKTNWNVSGVGGAAEVLGINASTLRGRMRKHGIRRADYLQKGFSVKSDRHI